MKKTAKPKDPVANQDPKETPETKVKEISVESLVNSIEDCVVEETENHLVVIDQPSVDWKSLIPPKYIAPNQHRLSADGIEWDKLTDEEVKNLDEKYKLVLLQGFKEVLRLHGFCSFQEKTEYFESVKGSDKAVTTCSIVWKGKDGESNTLVSTTGEAHYHNTTGFGRNYLVRISANRALVANVRLFLNIPITGQDELSGDENFKGGAGGASSPLLSAAVEKLYLGKGLSFEKIREKLYKTYPETSGATSFEDLNKYPKVLQSMTDAIQNG